MNIFITDADPKQCAMWLDDKRVVKMILESTQMLCTAINYHGGHSPYKSTHLNHPSNIWCRQSADNWTWLYNHALALCEVYTLAYKKTHKCQGILVALDASCIPTGVLTSFANCAANQDKGISYKHLEDVTEAYRLYLRDRWKTDARMPTWANRQVPAFIHGS